MMHFIVLQSKWGLILHMKPFNNASALLLVLPGCSLLLFCEFNLSFSFMMASGGGQHFFALYKGGTQHSYKGETVK